MSQSSAEFVQPDPEFVHLAELPDADALRASAAADPVGFWEREARELEWYTPWEKVLDDTGAPFFKWFTGATTNIVHNAIDRHLHGPYKNKLALIWVGENGTDYRTYSYFSLNREVTQMANILKAMGVRKGDRVTIYLPRIPEVVFAMLASYVFSRTLVPTLAMYLLRRHDRHAAPSRNPLAVLQRGFERGFARTRDAYRAVLVGLLSRRGGFVAAFLAVCLAAWLLLPWLGENFFPTPEKPYVCMKTIFDTMKDTGLVDPSRFTQVDKLPGVWRLKEGTPVTVTIPPGYFVQHYSFDGFYVNY